MVFRADPSKVYAFVPSALPPRLSWVDLEKGRSGLGLSAAANLKLSICWFLLGQASLGGSLRGQGKQLKVPELSCELTIDGFKRRDSQLLKTKANTNPRLMCSLPGGPAAKGTEVPGTAPARAGW